MLALGTPTRSKTLFALAAATAGAIVAVMGSALVMSGETGWFRAGLVSSLGFGLIGIAVLALARARALGTLGTAAGAPMAVGVLAVVGVAAGLDDPDRAPAWSWVGFVGWLGTYLLYPVWAFRLPIGPGAAATRRDRINRAGARRSVASPPHRSGRRRERRRRCDPRTALVRVLHVDEDFATRRGRAGLDADDVDRLAGEAAGADQHVRRAALAHVHARLNPVPCEGAGLSLDE